MYKPPFSISDKTIDLIAHISAQIERYVIRMEQEDGLMLRKINRIKTIQGSLAIEGNTLGTDQITAILEGKYVMGTIREIQEARNALKTYDAFSTFNPYKQTDLLRAHGLLMEALVDNHGKYRRGNVGVFEGDKPIHVAPPADRVSGLMGDLFDWLTNSSNHLLIKSCVFHYEFEFIHPFMDGNGRMGRLWQSLLLTKLHPVFEYLPVENMVFKNQQLYYKAINDSTSATDSGIFIEFMLGEILTTLKNRQGEPLEKANNAGVNVGVNVGVNIELERILDLIKQLPGINANQIAKQVPDKTKRTIERQLAVLKANNSIEFKGAPKSGGYYLKTEE
ncbi:MAG: Fic family protein [Bacteroidetes bacterium]|nr:Fic family protein [Bacteroidota bacterium]